uniref:Transposase IS30-like HTH domain-containing protein n=1 Tax=Oncorhynchus mykiss TaxID=8022 RepID=A0A8K9X6L5_ONCMY
MCAIQRVNRQDKILYLSAFEQGMVVDARSNGLSVSRTAMLLGFSRSTVSRVYQEWSTTQRTSSRTTGREECVLGRKQLVDDRGRRRTARVMQANRQATYRQITAQYNSGVQNGISECTTRRSMSQMGSTPIT